MSAQTVLITGCSAGGIGSAIAQSFHRRGFRVFATARNLDKVAHLKEMGMTVFPLDVVDLASINRVVESVTALTNGKLDFLVNNSGLGLHMPLIDADLNAVRNVYEVNVIGVLATVQAFAPLLISAKGTIVNIGSTAGLVPLPFRGAYTSSKAATNLLSDNLRLEMAPFDVKVICVIAGGVQTQFLRNLPPVVLPPTSYYAVAKERVEQSMVSLGDNVVAWSPERMGEAVVVNAIKTHPQVRHWTGYGANLVWVLTTFLWATVWDVFFPKRFGLNALKKAWEAQSRVH